MKKKLIYVTTGTCHYPFDRMLKIVKQCLKSITFDYELVLQYGKSSAVKMDNEIVSESLISRAESDKYYREADLIFSHCGIGSIFNSLKYNTPTIIIPRLEKFNEFSDDHQLQIANEIKTNPLVLMLSEDFENNTLAFNSFLNQCELNEKTEVDLVNYDLGNEIKAFFLCEETA